MRPEQRKSPRFLVQDDVIAALRDGFTRIGRVKDISIGGLSFEHIQDETSNLESFERQVFLLAGPFCLPKVPCKVVYDIPLNTPDEYQAFPIQFVTRRCGVRFGDLSGDQRRLLDDFLKTYTIGSPS